MKVVQILPELNAGGVERGTLEVAAHLVRQGHQAIVISNGGRLVPALEASGARHVSMPMHRKSLATLLQVRALRQFLTAERPDILHIRSRVPGWVAWLAWRGMPAATRPRLVSTVHGFYSVNAYSAIMTRGEKVIAVSESIREYILKNYPKTPAENIRVIHRGVSPEEFLRGCKPNETWMQSWQAAHPHLEGKNLLLLPGRITRWKGQQDFIHLIAGLNHHGLNVHGLIVGNTHPKKRAFLAELEQLTKTTGTKRDITFLNHRSDLKEIMSISSIVFSLSKEPEAFGRVSLEAMTLGIPVVGYDHGGVGEQLKALFPAGRIPPNDLAAATRCAIEILEKKMIPSTSTCFSLQQMLEKTLATYQALYASTR